MKFLFIGDVVGKLGRRTVSQVLPVLRVKESIDFVVANAENVSHGRGAKLKHLKALKDAGVDFFTSGDHIFHLDPDEPFSDPSVNIIRPANFPPKTPGVGYKIVEASGKKIAVLNLLGLTFLGERVGKDERYAWLEGEIENPFHKVEEILNGLQKEKPDFIFVDFHCELTSEKKAFGFFLDGKVTAVVGTHTHVPTADGVILPSGTAYISDIGMTGARDSVLGVEPSIIINRFKEGGTDPFQWVEQGSAVFAAVMVEIGGSGAVKSISRYDFVLD